MLLVVALFLPTPALARVKTETIQSLVPQDTDMVAVFSVPECVKFRSRDMKLSGVDVASWFGIDVKELSTVIAIVKHRDSCAMVFVCRGDASPMFEKVFRVLRPATTARKGRRGPTREEWTEPRPGVHLRTKSAARGQVLAQLGDNMFLWSLYDDAKGRLGLEIVDHFRAWREKDPKEAEEPSKEIARMVALAKTSMLAWTVLRPKSLNNSGVSRNITDLRQSGLKSVSGHATLEGDVLNEAVEFHFASPEDATRFEELSRNEPKSTEAKVVADFLLPLDRYVRQSPPEREPADIKAEKSVVRSTKSTTLPPRKSGSR